MLLSIKIPPRIPELLFAAVLVWLFASGQGWSVLLADGDTGWHIRNGEQIIDARAVPHHDSFSFHSESHPWFAWEWLSDVWFALLFRGGGLKAVSVFCGIVIAASLSLLFRHMVWRSIGVCIAFPVTLLVAGASSVHYLARPHVIGLLLFVSTAWIIDRDRTVSKQPANSAAIWMLPAIFVVWANCHGSFLAGFAILGLWCFERLVGEWFQTHRFEWRRFSPPVLLVFMSSAATFLNPYGWRLHAHALEYLRSDWILASVDEFQSPRFRSESVFQFEVLLLLGVAALPWLWRRREFYPGLLILLWAHEALTSVRHVPLYCAASAPYIASSIQAGWDAALARTAKASWLANFESINRTWQPWTRGTTIWPLFLCAALFSGLGGQPSSSVGFPANKFPVRLVERNLPLFSSASAGPQRIFSSDQWSDYLIFRFYPSIRIYFDGRSDFFGPWRGKNYQHLMAGGADASSILAGEDFALALIPKDWALSGILAANAHWRVIDEDQQAVLLTAATKNTAAPNQTSARVR